jgi:hypothetical protein
VQLKSNGQPLLPCHVAVELNLFCQCRGRVHEPNPTGTIRFCHSILRWACHSAHRAPMSPPMSFGEWFDRPPRSLRRGRSLVPPKAAAGGQWMQASPQRSQLTCHGVSTAAAVGFQLRHKLFRCHAAHIEYGRAVERDGQSRSGGEAPPTAAASKAWKKRAQAT